MQVTLQLNNLSVSFQVKKVSTCGMRSTNFINLVEPSLTKEQLSQLQDLGFGIEWQKDFQVSKSVDFSLE